MVVLVIASMLTYHKGVVERGIDVSSGEHQLSGSNSGRSKLWSSYLSSYLSFGFLGSFFRLQKYSFIMCMCIQVNGVQKYDKVIAPFFLVFL